MDLRQAYKILEISENSSISEVKQAYRDLAQIWHPDRQSHNERLQRKALEKMKELNAAYDYIRFHLKTEKTPGSTERIIVCPRCGTKNRVPSPSSNMEVTCGRCGSRLFREQDKEQPQTDWEDEMWCGDGTCIGIIDSNGKCTKCGKTYKEGVEAEKTKTEEKDQRQQARKLKARRKKKTIYIAVAIGLIILSILLLGNSQSPSNSGSRSPNFTTKAAPPVGQLSPNSIKDNRAVNPLEVEWDSAKPLIPEQPLPLTGSVRKLTVDESVAPFQIKADQGTNYLVKLVDTHSGSPVLTVFVRSGTTVEIKVPLGSYEVRYASGERWYGNKQLFGSGTTYSKAETIFKFEVIGNQVSGYTITLYKVPNGNLRTRNIKQEEF